MPAVRTEEHVVVDLVSTDATMGELVGGKAGNLGEAMTAGLAVPEGFCVTTNAYAAAVASSAELRAALAALDGVGADDTAAQAALAARARDAVTGAEMQAHVRDAIVAGYERLGGERVAVAVRSSATAEDLPFASFAGQQDTYLGVTGAAAVVDAVRRCWASLWTDRAVGYRAANGVAHGAVRIAVVVQVMVDAAVSGVLFTANPVTGKRTEMVADAAPGLGEGVVSGTVETDHYVLGADDGDAGAPADGCLTATRLAALRELGQRLEAHFGSPQDAEWSFTGDGALWLLQSRPITTLFPIPETSRQGTRMYLSVSSVQGVQQPVTPMGISVLRMTAAAMWRLSGVEVDPYRGPEGFVVAGGRMFADMTALVRSRSLRKNLPEQLEMQGRRVQRAVEHVLDDPRFSPVPGLPFPPRRVARAMARFGAPALVSAVRTLARPADARARAYRLAAELERRTTAPAGELTPEQRLDFVRTAAGEMLGTRMMRMVYILFGGLGASGAPGSLLGEHAAPGDLDAVLRGMPHNPTTEMDLELWRIAANAGEARELLATTPPARLAEMYHAGELPDVGIAGFLGRYGRRAVAEIDVGVPRWAEDPAPVFAVLANYLRLTGDDETPDVRFARNAADAERLVGELVARARRQRPVRARLAGFLMRRAREVAGLRELPKFATLHGFWEIRRQLLLVGDELASRGLLARADDVMFLDVPEARSALGGADLRAVVERRRAEHEREKRRRYLPVVLLSDGTEPEAELPASVSDDGALVGMPAAPGVVTGTARVVLDPSGAHLEPGEILVAPSTDPGWTPLFLTAGGLVSETGAPNSHGPTVAREYGIPAVIGIRSATSLIRSGDRLTVDGAAGTVTVEPALVDR